LIGQLPGELHVMKFFPKFNLVVWALILPWFSSSSQAETVRRDPMTIDFSSMPTDSKPPGFTEALTGQGKAVRWLVLDDPSAPTGGKVIAETSGDSVDYRFPICVYDGLTAKDVEVSVQFKPVAGSVDQAGGIIARVQDKLNYYVTRANALEDNVRLYKVVGGERRQIAGQNLKVTAGAWHTLFLKVEGDLLEVSFDGKRVIQTRDSTFGGPGKVGLWTKADSLTYFSNLKIVVNDKQD
jgi:hypothetical protein